MQTAGCLPLIIGAFRRDRYLPLEVLHRCSLQFNFSSSAMSKGCTSTLASRRLSGWGHDVARFDFQILPSALICQWPNIVYNGRVITYGYLAYIDLLSASN
jgi:hypothetical protein